jgi:drug/metabolite transporter (DMT)-like permease
MMIFASFVFASMGAFVKVASRDLNSVQIVFFRNVIGIIFILSSLLRKPLKNNGGRFGLLMFRGISGTLALYALFYNMGEIGLGKSITFIQTAPIFIAIFSMMFLNERLSLPGWLAVFIGFGGILLIFRPDLTSRPLNNFLGIFNGVFAAAAYTSVRELKKHYDTRSIVLSFMSWGIILPLLSMLFAPFLDNQKFDFLVSPFVWPAGEQWFWLIMVGITAMLGQVYITKAYGEEKAGIISTVGYVNIPFAIFLGVLLGDPLPNLVEIAGILLIIISGAVISMRRNI